MKTDNRKINQILELNRSIEMVGLRSTEDGLVKTGSGKTILRPGLTLATDDLPLCKDVAEMAALAYGNLPALVTDFNTATGLLDECASVLDGINPELFQKLCNFLHGDD